MFGKLSIRRWVYARGTKKKIEYAPTDARLGLPRGEYSYVLEDWLQRLCVKEPFVEGIDGLSSILGVEPSVQTAEEMNQRMAEHAEAFRMQQPAPPPTTAETIVVATADGTSVPMRRADRSKTPHPQAAGRRGATRRAYIGVVYSIEPFVRGPQDVLDELFRDEVSTRRPRPQGKRLWAEMAAAVDGSLISGIDRVFVELAIDVKTRDPDRLKTLVCLMDGERKLWDLQQEWLGRSVEILDFFHVLERVRDVSKVVHPQDKSRREVWVTEQTRDLLNGKVETVIRRWRRLQRQAEKAKNWTSQSLATVSSAITYFTNNRHRMCYDEYLSQGYPIGSGVAEGACRNLVKDRLDCTGMHWRLAGAQAMLNTRALYLSGEWDDFVEFRIQREQQTLYQNAA
ncbi:MAG: ISKra4 family transposase [Pirellulaceae bacterium]